MKSNKTQEQISEEIRQINAESRRRTEAMGEKWIETTALDAKLSRGSAVIALNIAKAVDEASKAK